MARPRKSTGSRNTEIARSINRFGRAASFHRKGLWAQKLNKKPKAAAKKAAAAPTKKKFQNGERVIEKKGTGFYPTEDIKTPKVRHFTPKPAKLRSTIKKGTVLILLAGRHRGKRVIFLKQLPSGLLLVTGPFKVNGVPLRRVNQAYVIATSTSVDISSVKIDAKFDDKYFAKPAAQKKKKSEGEFFAKETEKKAADPAKVADQKALDAVILPLIKKTAKLDKYLGSKFSLSSGQYPHTMKF
jgi:large subunit ribosomal protein L6e